MKIFGILIICAVFLMGCSDDSSLVVEPGYSTVIVSIASTDSIFIQGREGKLTATQFRTEISQMLVDNPNLAFVIQSPFPKKHPDTQVIVEALLESGVKERHLVIAEQSA